MVIKKKINQKHWHDLVFRSILIAPDVLANLLRNYLPKKQVAKLDLDYIICESPVTVDGDLDERRGDLLFRTRFKGSGEELHVLVVVEHQSTPEYYFIVRAIEYVAKAFKQHIMSPRKEKKGGKPGLLPYPLVVVLYNGEKPWEEIPQISDLIASVPGFDKNILQLPICLIDLPRIPPEELKGNGIVRALLDSMKSATNGTLDARYETIISHLEDVKEDHRVETWAKTLTRYALEQTGLKGGIERIRRAYQRVFTKQEADKMVMTTADELRLEGEVRGRAEGRAEGMTKGMAKGMAKMIIDILTERFGKIPASLEKKINAIHDSARLSDLGKRVATCTSLNDFKKAL